MKLIYTFLVLSCFITATVYAQEPLDCDKNINRALRYLHYLNSSTNVKADSIKAVEYLEPCVDAENAVAQLIMARLYLNSDDEKRNKKGFKLTKKAAKQDLDLAAYDLGVLFKYGKGTEQNLVKASRWFRKGYDLGNSKAAYSLGYMFFKGFGNETQDYNKAVKWFRKSDYPMAKHWLAVCYYFGYGVEQDKPKALQLLRENPIENSEILLNTLNNSNGENGLNEEEVVVLNEFQNLENNNADTNISANNLIGNWVGSIIQFDWSNTMIMQKLSASINFKKDSITEDVLYESMVGDNYNTGIVNDATNDVALDNLLLTIKHPYSSNAIEMLDYEIVPSAMQLITYNDDEFIVFTTESFIDGWKEPGAPMLFILRKERIFTDNNVEVSNEAITALESQENFIKSYPNPFINDLIIAYDLETSLYVNVDITSIDGSTYFPIVTNGLQNEGKHRYYFDSSTLEKGVYVIAITYGNERETKIIVKN